MMTPSDMLVKLREWQPTAHDVRIASECHCKRGRMLFYQISDFKPRRGDGRVAGGYYCPACDFGNAGAMLIADYETAERIDV